MSKKSRREAIRLSRQAPVSTGRQAGTKNPNTPTEAACDSLIFGESSGGKSVFPTVLQKSALAGAGGQGTTDNGV